MTGTSNVLILADRADEAMERLAPFMDVPAIVSAASPLAMEFELSIFNRVKFFTWRFGGAVEVTARFDRHLICTARPGGISIDDESLVLDEAGAAILPSGMRRFHWKPGAMLTGIAMDEGDFRQAAQSIMPDGAGFRFGPCRAIDLLASPGDSFSNFVDYLLMHRKGGESGMVSALFERLIVYSLMQLVRGGDPEKSRAHDLAPRHVKQAEDYIKAHLSDDLDSAMLARIADVSPRSLYRGFIDFRGTTPARYIQALRLEKVHRLLMEGFRTRDIRSIAASAGFRSYPAFWRSYVRKFGVPPSKARPGNTSTP
jgi:AraC-like DNA-binding protein